MRRVYSTDSVPMAWHVRNVLEQHDIPAEVRNTNLFSVAGELPITECQAEVWVSVLYFARAEQLIRDVEQEATDEGPNWICSACREENLPQYACCWNCQRENSSTADSDVD